MDKSKQEKDLALSVQAVENAKIKFAQKLDAALHAIQQILQIYCPAARIVADATYKECP
jgi:hypothetical protein